MDVFCEICGKRYDSRDPAVTYWHSDGAWACYDEDACFGRVSIQRALDAAAASMRVVEP